ncbi:MAG: hypothetical protein HDS68_02525 [Bacteroidales bacterium]|nr:hypothetical protein [Bacteroidales bacterium]
MNDGWIKLFYRLLDWEWYGNPNMVALFIHLLLKANFKPQKWRASTIPRGTLVTNLAKLHQETGLSIQQIRTCLNRLKSTNEITIKTTNKEHIITLCNYKHYQSDAAELSKPANKQNNKPSTNHQQTINKPSTNPIYNKKEKKKEREDGETRTRVCPPPPTPPPLMDVNLRDLPNDLLLDHFITQALESQIWLESIALKLKTTIQQITFLVQHDFRQHCICEGKRHNNLSDFQSHFNRWAGQQKFSSPNATTTNSTHPTDRHPGSLASKLPPQPACGIKRRPNPDGKT